MPWRTYQSADPISIVDVTEHLLSLITARTREQPCWLIASPGQGKSIASQRLAARLIDTGQRVAHVTGAALRYRRAEAAFGTTDWCETYLHLTDPSASTLILDGVDDLLVGLDMAEIARLARLPILLQSCLITCRLTYFERYLSRTLAARRAIDKLELLPIDKPQQDALVHAYLTELDRTEVEPAFTTWLDDPAWCQNPM